MRFCGLVERWRDLCPDDVAVLSPDREELIALLQESTVLGKNAQQQKWTSSCPKFKSESGLRPVVRYHPSSRDLKNSRIRFTPVRLDVEQHQLFRSIDNLGFFVIALEHKRDGRFLEQSGGKDLQNCVERMLKAQSFFDNGDQDINSNGNPNLGLDAVRGSAEETFDPKVLFDPFEKEFDMPAVAINGGHGQRR